MLDIIKFLLSLAVQLASYLFSIDIGFTNLGTLLAIIGILFPVLLFVFNSLKHQVVSEFKQDKYERQKERRKK